MTVKDATKIQGAYPCARSHEYFSKVWKTPSETQPSCSCFVAVLQVPPGTVVRLKGETEGKALAEVLQDGDRALLMVGGRGGRGNASFKSQRNK